MNRGELRYEEDWNPLEMVDNMQFRINFNGRRIGVTERGIIPIYNNIEMRTAREEHRNAELIRRVA